MIINLETREGPCKIYDANGVEIERVIEADTNTGKVLQYLHPYIRSTGDGTSTEYVSAKVYAYYPFPLRVENLEVGTTQKTCSQNFKDYSLITITV